jgi:hypothetical protein
MNEPPTVLSIFPPNLSPFGDGGDWPPDKVKPAFVCR